MGERHSPLFDLKRRVGLSEKRVENSIRTKRRKFAEDFVTPAIVPNPTRLPVGEESPRDGHLSVGRWTCVWQRTFPRTGRSQARARAEERTVCRPDEGEARRRRGSEATLTAW